MKLKTTFELWKPMQRLWDFQKFLVLILFGLLAPNYALAGPSYQDANMEYDFPRPLKIVTKISNGYRFEIITPEQSEKTLGKDIYGSNSSWFGDRHLIIWPPIGDAEDWPSEPIYIRRLKSGATTFIKNGPLSDDYVIIREWSGGASCCSIIQAFQTKPEFKKLIEHNNDFFDVPIIPVGEHEIELHEKPPSYPSSHSQLKYNPKLFDLKTLEWKFPPQTHGVIQPASTDETQVLSRDGNIYLISNSQEKQLTDSGLDHSPVLSPDRKFIVFSREGTKRIAAGACCDGDPPLADQLWMVSADGSGEKLLIAERDNIDPEQVLTKFNRKQFSSDGSMLFFLTPAWATSDALHVFNFNTGQTSFVQPAGSFHLLSQCNDPDYRDHLIINQHRYFVFGGSYDWNWLYKPSGQEVGPIGETLDPVNEKCGLALDR